MFEAIWRHQTISKYKCRSIFNYECTSQIQTRYGVDDVEFQAIGLEWLCSRLWKTSCKIIITTVKLLIVRPLSFSVYTRRHTSRVQGLIKKVFDPGLILFFCFQRMNDNSCITNEHKWGSSVILHTDHNAYNNGYLLPYAILLPIKHIIL